MQHPQSQLRDITGEIIAYATTSRFETLPEIVQLEASRAFLNWLGCALGGSRQHAVDASVALATDIGGVATATIIGRGIKTDIVEAAFINCLSSAALAYDDTHLATVTHPTGPVAAVLLAWAERERVTGAEFLNALTLGIEMQCRLSNVLLLAPAKANLGLYITGITGPIGAAVALGRLMQLDEAGMRSAIGLAATQAAGLRATHASMAGAFPPAHAARTGMLAALLAAKGFGCSPQVLEAGKGLIEVFGPGADLGRAVDGLGQTHEMLTNAYKPYPCGIVVQPAIDACLDIATRMTGTPVQQIELTLHPLALTLANRPSPKTFWEAQVSLQHWAAVALLRRTAGIAETRQDCIDDSAIVALRRRVVVHADETVGRDAARATVTFADGTATSSTIEAARGSVKRPMTDAELDAKFRGQAETVLAPARVERLLHLCRTSATVEDVGTAVAAVLD